ncbi:hypothetical protein BH09ACT3_BH09ACT3_00710 [soil metagenome]
MDQPALWQSGSVTDDSDIRWLSIPELVALMAVPLGRVRRFIEDRSLLASEIDGVLKVPELFVRDGEPLGELKGTLVVLHDAGFSDDESMRWLLSTEDSIGTAPIEALRAGRKAEVRRVAQALGF